MNVLVSAVSHGSGVSGVQRHALNLVRALETCPKIDEVHIALGPWQDTMHEELSRSAGSRLKVHTADTGRGALSRNAWHYFGLPGLAARLLVDVVHFTYPVPVNATGLICRSVVTLHDLYPYEIPSNFGIPKVLINRWILRECLRAVDGIACVSDHTMNELGRRKNAAAAAKAVRVYNCVEPPSHRSTNRSGALDELHGSPFLLCVAQHRRNKNLPFLLTVFATLLKQARITSRTRLVIVGVPGPETNSLLRLIARSRLGPDVLLLDGLSNEQLQWCFASCEALLAPSLTEGFGLPVVEGLQAGCRVVCSDIPAFREFGEGHCRFVRLEGSSAESRFADAIQRSLGEPKPRAVCFPHLSSPAVGRECFAFYESVLNQHWVYTKEQAIKQPGGKPVERRVV